MAIAMRDFIPLEANFSWIFSRDKTSEPVAVIHKQYENGRADNGKMERPNLSFASNCRRTTVEATCWSANCTGGLKKILLQGNA